MLEIYLRELSKLNKYQLEAVKAKDKYAVLNAAVGSGKTTVLTHKVLYLHLFEKIKLEDIMVLTFTNKAAKEIRDRVLEFSDALKEEFKYFGTFHSVARSILADSPRLKEIGYSNDFDVIDNEEAGELLLEILEREKLNIKYKSKLIKRIEEFKKGKVLYGVMKNTDDINKLYKLYTEEKIKRNVMDFDDLIIRCIEILDKPLSPKWIIIDEFQDTDLNQLQLIKKLSGESTNIFVIGDPNQEIYSFRTGISGIFNEFKRTYNPKEYTLPINYRSSRTIIEAAKVFLGDNGIQSSKEYGNKIMVKKHHDAFNEALYISRKIKEFIEEGLSYKDIAVLYRRQSQGDIISEIFSKEGIPYKKPFKRPLIFEDSISMEDEDNKVNLLTLHASKGLEFSHIFIIGANMGNMPISSKREEEEEEARLFFVGLTRAKNYIEISYHVKPSLQGVSPYMSPYITMIPQNLITKEEEKNSPNLSTLMNMLREEREKKRMEERVRRAKHPKYGEGIVVFEDENIIRVNFEAYGEKEFSKVLSPISLITY